MLLLTLFDMAYTEITSGIITDPFPICLISWFPWILSTELLPLGEGAFSWMNAARLITFCFFSVSILPTLNSCLYTERVSVFLLLG